MHPEKSETRAVSGKIALPLNESKCTLIQG